MPTISTLTVDVVTNTSKFSKGLRTAVTGLAVLAGGAVYAFKQFEDSEQVLKQTDAVLKSTGNSANTTATHITDLANALSEKAGIDDEVIQAGENMLLTFKNIRNEVGKGNDIFDQATKATVDLAAGMAAASGGEVDLKASSIQLGKALNDPVAGLTSLTRVGVQFTEQQTKQIAKMVESGNILGAQKIILAEITSQFQGSAVANATASGKLSVAFGNLAESIGGVLAPVIEKVIGWLTSLADWFTSLPKSMQTFITTAAAVVAVIILVGKAFNALTLAMSINPYVLIIAATIAVAILIVKNWDTIKKFLLAVWDAIVAAGKWAWDHLAIFILGPMKLVIDFLIDHWRGFAEFFKAVWDRISDIVKTAVGFIVADIKMIVDAIMAIVHAVQTAISWLDKFKGAASVVAGAPGLGGGGVAQFVEPHAAGGIFTKPHIGLIAESGPEAVIPLNQAGMLGGTTIVNNFYGDTTGEEIVRKVRDGLLKLKARNATTGL